MDGQDYAELGEDDKGPLAIAVEIESVDRKDKLTVKKPDGVVDRNCRYQVGGTRER